ncbi:MAG: rod-binding protein [Rhodobacteraceae bacterium]|nr:rod-binding protein [Paracoccaceae bacterium]
MLPSVSPHGRGHSDPGLWQAAQDLEASFLAEMLKPMGADSVRTSFGGGAGEEQFSTFLQQEQARGMVRAGGIGLAESIFTALKARGGAADVP